MRGRSKVIGRRIRVADAFDLKAIHPRAENLKALSGICSENPASHLMLRKFYAAGITPSSGKI
jgi:hypothetical protein